jgi:hypothetical protein
MEAADVDSQPGNNDMFLKRAFTTVKYNDKITPVTENIPLGEHAELE